MHYVFATLAGGLADTLRDQPLLALATLFGAGVLTSLTPCIYPMIPITAGIIAGGADTTHSRTRTITLTLTYALGLALVYSTLGLLAGLSGNIFGTVSSNPWARFVTGNLLLVFGLVMLDVIPLRAPRRLTAWAGGLGAGSYPAVLLLGATSGLVAAPCGAPAFAAVLTFVAATRNAGLGFLYLLVFSFGMTAILIAVGLFSGSLARLPRSGPWLIWVKRIAGAILIAAAEYYFIQMGMVY